MLRPPTLRLLCIDSQPLELGFERASASESWLGFLRLKCKITISHHVLTGCPKVPDSSYLNQRTGNGTKRPLMRHYRILGQPLRQLSLFGSQAWGGVCSQALNQVKPGSCCPPSQTNTGREGGWEYGGMGFPFWPEEIRQTLALLLASAKVTGSVMEPCRHHGNIRSELEDHRASAEWTASLAGPL